uniref:Tyrosyl-DNA phosphodiesterase 2a n=1 Tax=Cyprinus carpio TaxID=7962 RepID=A0A8C1IJB0_CYPCA
MLRKDRVQFLQSNMKYPTTEMGRNLLIAHVSFLVHPLCIITSHLESSQGRLNQLRKVWKQIKEAPEDHTVIFGGDTNLRDWEVVHDTKARGLPYGISEVWEMLGELEKSKYTWDTSINVNKEIPHSIRLRFDRLFLRAAAEGAQLWPESMTLIGLEKLKCDYSSAITSLRHQKSSVSMIDFNCYGLHMIIQLNESQCFINKSLLINEI